MIEKQRCLSALIAAVVTLAAEVALGQWHAEVTAPRPGLPSVEIDLGYPGGYVPRTNSPIDIRARSGEQPFDGYIGYHIAVGDNMTVDVPVIARAVLAPRSQWAFSTSVQVARSVLTSVDRRYFKRRELVIEWLGPNLNRIAQRSVGVPPWVDAPQPLRIAWPDEKVVATSYLGNNATVIDAAALSSVPQWYAGFSAVVVPISRWFELPTAIRETIFRSGTHVVFFGIPDRVPPMTATDRALLPIELRPAGSRVDVPWPYGDGKETAIPAAMSWRAKKKARICGSTESPYLVSNSVATFAADEKAIRGALPSFAFSMPTEWDVIKIERHWPTVAEIFREHRPAIAFIILLLLSVTTWVVFRRTPRAAVVAVALVAALGTLGWRSAIHSPEDTYTLERRAIAAPGVVDVLIARNDYGGTPRRIPSKEAAAQRGRVTLRVGERVGGDTELRTSQTPPGFGDVDAPGRPWLATTRRSAWRELGEPATIRIRTRDANQLVVEYRSEASFNYVAAEWAWNGERRYGEAHLDSGRSEVTVRNARDVWPRLGTTIGRTRVVLMRVERGRTVAVHEIDPEDVSGAPGSYVIQSTLRTDTNGKLSATLLLPRPVPPDAAISIAFPMFGVGHVRKSATLSGSGGSVKVEARWTGRLPIAADIRASEMQRVAPAGGIVRVDVEPSGSAPDMSEATVALRVREKPQ